MPNTTPNLGLIKPLVTEQYDIAKVTNENADILDLEVFGKQPTLVSGTNIKTINGDSILGSGDLPVLMPRNWIINGMFDVWQRGTSQTSIGYGSDDRWFNYHSEYTKTHSRQAFVVGQTEVPNNPTYFSRTTITSVSSPGAGAIKIQRIEDVTKFAGKTIAFSFWAKADANKNIAINFAQNFGTGGSAGVDVIGSQLVALTTSWAKKTITVMIPSVSGKTIGAGNYLELQIYFGAGSAYVGSAGLGHQSGTFDIANVSLVEGSVAVECQNQPYADVLRECQRYCYGATPQAAYGTFGLGMAASANYLGIYFFLPTSMRVAPTSMEVSSLASFYWQGATIGDTPTTLTLASDSTEYVAGILLMKTGAWTVGSAYSLNRNNLATAYIIFSAEL